MIFSFRGLEKSSTTATAYSSSALQAMLYWVSFLTGPVITLFLSSFSKDDKKAVVPIS